MDNQQATLNEVIFYFFMLTPVKKGTLGEIAVSKEFAKLGLSVFIQLGNDSKVDLIVLDDKFNPIKIQIKSTKSRNGIVEVYSTKNCLNPKYNSLYQIEQIDVFAIYIIDKDLVFYVSAKEILTNSKVSKFRLSTSKNGQIKNVRFVSDYLDFKKALRDYTPHTLTNSVEGDEIVQTTTPEFSAADESRCGK